MYNVIYGEKGEKIRLVRKILDEDPIFRFNPEFHSLSREDKILFG